MTWSRRIVPKLFGYCVALAAERHGILVHVQIAPQGCC